MNKSFHVECREFQAAKGPIFEETVEAIDAKAAKKLAAAHAKEKGLHPTAFIAVEVPTALV